MEDTAQPLSTGITEPLRRARPWMKFIAIMGFIGFGFLVLDALVMALSVEMLPRPMASPALPVGLMAFLSLLYVVVGFFVYFMPPYLLIRSASALDGIESKGTLAALAEASERQRRFWKYCGVLLIVGLCVFVLFAIAAAIALPIIALHHPH